MAKGGRGRSNRNFKHGQYTGWDEFRYGDAAKPVTLAGKKKPRPIFADRKRAHVVKQVMDILRDWRESPLEREAMVRYGLRSALCLEHHPWAKADAAAAEVVADGLRLLGAVRPTWEQGQREYTTPPENCSWCGVDVPQELLFGRRKTRFCSDVCARSAIRYREFKVRRYEDETFLGAREILMRTSHDARTCRHCAISFRPMFDGGEFCSRKCSMSYDRQWPERACRHCQKTFRPKFRMNVFCSNECVSAAYRTVPDAICQQCNKLFRPATKPTDGHGRFCSRECFNTSRGIGRFHCTCVWCGKDFLGKTEGRQTCGQTCASQFSNIRSGRWVPKRISPPVFDYVFGIMAA